MDKAVIFQPFEFIGFHLCSRLLEQGISVCGIKILTEKSPFEDEKSYEIGRNANFETIELTDLENPFLPTADFMFLPIYDWFIAEKENAIFSNQFKKKIINFCRNSKVILLAPIQLAFNEPAKYLLSYQQFSDMIRNEATIYQTFFLPSVYGPWQPENSSFQSLILEDLLQTHKETVLSKREWENDTIFIDDLINAILNTVDTGQAGEYICKSERSDQWMEGLRVLGEQNIDSQTYTAIKKEREIPLLTIETATPIERGIGLQKEHAKRMMNLRDI